MSTDHAQTSTAPEHLCSGASVLLTEGPATRIESVLQGMTVGHGRLMAIINKVEWLMAESGALRTRGLLVSSPPGNGKTSLGAMLIAKYPLAPPPLDSSGRGLIEGCAVQVNLAGVRTAKAFFIRLLAALHSDSTRGTATEMELRTKDILRRAKCKLLVIDEMQDLLNAPEREQLKVIETIKNLMTELRIPVLALGTVSAHENFHADPHMMARFKTIELPLWRANDELAALLKGIESTLPLPAPSNLSDPKIMKKLVKTTGGVLAEMLLIIREAAVRVIASGEDRITTDMLDGNLRMPDASQFIGAAANAA